ncbi:MAG: glycine cleavage system protein H, partial [Thermoanaerobaculia bacterium]|nr:glycine cleavage system protein H [Thermoanaerobaculia bacterium]
MEALLTFLQVAVIFVAGLLIRLLLLIAFVAAALVPILAGWGFYRVAERTIRRLRARRLGLVEVGGLVLAERRRYTPAHAWLEETGGRLRVGLDGLAGHLLHGVTAVQLPQPGSMLEAGRAAVTVACGARTAIIPSPVTGTVVAVNAAVSRRPSLVESSPYGRGWLYSVRPASDTYRSFPTGAVARAWFHADEARLAHFLEGELGLAAADG